MTALKKFLVSPYLLFWMCVSAYFGYGKITALIFLFALLHESAHIFVLLVLKKRIRKISFGVTGAVIESEPLTYTQETVCAAAGPLMNLALCFLYFWEPLYAYINAVLLLYNSLPVYPLDGGRILCGYLLRRMDVSCVQRIIKRTNLFVCVVLMLISVSAAILFRWGLLPVFLTAAILCRTASLAEKDGY